MKIKFSKKIVQQEQLPKSSIFLVVFYWYIIMKIKITSTYFKINKKTKAYQFKFKTIYITNVNKI